IHTVLNAKRRTHRPVIIDAVRSGRLNG
ncbi:hypothetical protein D018_0983B, partial [Vibrio parahaemolyticus VP2007-007]